MTPQWVKTETTSKITVKGLFVVVLVKIIGNSSMVHVRNRVWPDKLGVAYAERSQPMLKLMFSC